MVTQPVITVQTILEQGSPVRNLKHLQVQRIFPSHSLLEISVLEPKSSPNTKKVNDLGKKKEKKMKPSNTQTVRADSNTTLLAVRLSLL